MALDLKTDHSHAADKLVRKAKKLGSLKISPAIAASSKWNGKQS